MRRFPARGVSEGDERGGDPADFGGQFVTLSLRCPFTGKEKINGFLDCVHTGSLHPRTNGVLEFLHSTPTGTRSPPHGRVFESDGQDWNTMAGMPPAPKPQPGDHAGADAEEFVRRMLHISPEDAETVRERTPGTRPEKHQQEGASADYGDEDER
jgi:hypothetical protein